MTTCPGSVRPKCRSATLPLHDPPTKSATIVSGLHDRAMAGAAPRARGLRPIRTCRERTGCSRRRAPWHRSSAGIRDSGLGDSGFDPDRRLPSVMQCADDARAGEAIVEPAMVAAEQRRDETEARRHRQQEPHQLPQERVAEIERRRFGRHHADARGHLAERLTAGRERDEVAAVLDEEEREQWTLRQDAEIFERQAADLHREVDDDRVDRREEQQIDGHGEDARHDRRVLLVVCRLLRSRRRPRHPASALTGREYAGRRIRLAVERQFQGLRARLFVPQPRHFRCRPADGERGPRGGRVLDERLVVGRLDAASARHATPG